MSITSLLLFASVYALAVATPGPGVAAVIARSLAHGTSGAAAFIAGFVVGDLLWFAAAATGLAALAQSGQFVFAVIRYAGAAYLFWLAWKLWRAPAEHIGSGAGADGHSAGQLFLTTLTLTLGNPKTMMFFLALLPSVVDLHSLQAFGFAELAFVIAVVLPLVLGAYVLLASRARSLFRSARAIRNMHRGTGIVMAAAATAVATRT